MWRIISLFRLSKDLTTSNFFFISEFLYSSNWLFNEESFAFLTKNIFQVKTDYFKAISKRDRAIMRSRWYHKVLLKDVWLRKYMQELGLYLKEIANDPGSVLFGSGR